MEHARHYLSGLLGTQRRKNIEAIGADVQGSDYQGMEQFISTSPWEHEPLLEQLAGDVDGLLGASPDSAFYIDETSFIKKGARSAGVKRQYCGRAGKIENCQVGVFGGLGCGTRACLTDFRLFLPEDWASDGERCRRAKIPPEHQVHRTKQALALEMVQTARARGLRFSWVGADALYGSCAQWLNDLEDMGEHFVADINRVTKVWTEAPVLQAPAPPTARGGRRRKRQVLTQEQPGKYIAVEQLAAESFADQNQEVTYRLGTHGPLTARVWVREVWTWEPDQHQARRRWLIISESAEGKRKYSLSNCLHISEVKRLCYMQYQRYFIEHAFHEAKGQLGMAQYQVRVWRGWHHHMALVCLAMLFTLREQLTQASNLPLLSLRDLTELLDFYLPRRHHDPQQLIHQIQLRHRTRQRDLNRRQQIHSPPKGS